MPTIDDVGRIAATLPGSEEKPSGGGLAWFVRRKPFAWESAPWPSEAEHIRAIVSTEPCVGVTLADEDDKQALAQGWPDAFAISETKWGGPKIIIRLGAVDPDHLVELVTESWRLQAPSTCARSSMRRRGTVALDNGWMAPSPSTKQGWTIEPWVYRFLVITLYAVATILVLAPAFALYSGIHEFGGNAGWWPASPNENDGPQAGLVLGGLGFLLIAVLCAVVSRAVAKRAGRATWPAAVLGSIWLALVVTVFVVWVLTDSIGRLSTP